MSRAIIVSNGFCRDYSFYKDKISDDDFVICADGGIRHLLEIKRLPDLWIGDFDSCRLEETISRYLELKDVKRLSLKKDKDETDTHYCCMKAIDMGYSEIIIMFSGGGRLDHALSNIHLLEYISKSGATGQIVDEKNTISLCKNSISIPKRRKYLSIIPLDSEITVESTKGLLYPLYNYTLTRDISMGVSNEITDKEALINIKSGYALIVESDD